MVSKNTGASQPLYKQVEETLKEMIEGVEFAPGDQIPSERELSDMLGVSRMTARKAVENLIQSGLLERRSTLGTYVRQPRVVRQLGFGPQGLTQQLSQDGQQVQAKLLEFEVVRAPRRVADYLEIRLGELTYRIKRLRLVNNIPFCIETSYLPAAYFKDLSQDDLIHNSSLYGLLRQRYQVEMAQAAGTVSISRCTSDEAKCLELNEGDPVMFSRFVAHDSTGRPVEYVKSINHPDRVAFKTFRELS